MQIIIPMTIKKSAFKDDIVHMKKKDLQETNVEAIFEQ